MSSLFQTQQAIAKGDINSAQLLLEKHLQQQPSDLDALYLLGVCEQSVGQVAQAQALYQKILGKAPQHFGAHYNLALLLSGSGDDVGAMPHHDAAIRLDPKQYWAYINRGNARARVKDLEGALSDFQTALAVQPMGPEAYTNMGNVLREVGRYEDALTAHEKALQLRPDYLDAFLNKAGALIKLKRAHEALACLAVVLKHQPDNSSAWSNQGSALQLLKRLPEAVASLSRALELQPDFSDARVNRGNLHAEMKQMEAAIEDYVTALQRDPHIPLLMGSHLNALLQQCQWDRYADLLKGMEEAFAANHLPSNPFDTLACLDDPRLQQAMTERYIERMHPAPRALPPLGPHPKKEKIRLGYFSSDFQTHPVSLLLAELFELHDKSRFELVAFSFGESKADPLRQRLSPVFDQFLDVSTLNDREVAELARRQGIDIAIDLNGHTLGARTDVFALRAAPVQVSYLGYAGTLGAPYMDYVLADRVVVPPDHQAFFTEKVAYLPDCFMPHDSTQAISTAPISRQDHGLPENGFVFCCFNNAYKLNPPVFDIWMRLLNKVPGSVLWLSSANQTVQNNLRREAQARGIAGERLIFAERMERMEDHLARYRLADLFLDTAPYNAHATAMDALWAGLPVLTCAGQTFASRVAASLLTHIGLQELITTSSLDYEEKALMLATNVNQLHDLRTRLAANRLSFPLFDTRRLVANLEKLFSAMIQSNPG